MMNTENASNKHHTYLKRLPPEYYRGQAYVHWTMTMQNRKAGWLSPLFYYKFKELLTHTMFRYAICCPIFCCMPDHIHLLWMGILPSSDQRKAMKYFRRHLNAVLQKLDVKLQKQAYDHVLRETERKEIEFRNIVEYIAHNPEHANLVEQDKYHNYPYTDCLVPGYPELKLFEPNFWERFWRIYEFLNKNGLIL